MAAALLLIGAGLLVYAFLQFLNPQSGWETITANSSAGASSAEDFTLLYYPGAGGASPTAERRGVTQVYTSLARNAYELFHAGQGFDGMANVYAINRRPNEVLEVEPGLYAAFGVVQESGSRALYLGPVYNRYFDLFSCQDDVQLVDFDPRLSQDVAREYREICAYANDRTAVSLELLGENRVRLNVSAEYLAYARREGIEDFIDFSWMTNAFIADFLANGLAAQGYTHGTLTSYDGFSRCLDMGETEYSLQFYSRVDNTVYPAAVLHYTGPLAVVSLRDYPVNDQDARRFYTLRSGERRTPYLDPADGLCRNALPELTCYSAGSGCGAMLLAMLPVYVAEEFRPERLDALYREGISSVYCRDYTLHTAGGPARLDDFFDSDGVRFTAAG